MKNFGKGEKWVLGNIIKLLGSKWVLVKRCDGIMCKRHVNQLRHNREISQEMAVNDDEFILHRENPYKYNKGISMKFDNYNRKEVGEKDNFSGVDKSQISSDTVADEIVNNSSTEIVDKCIANNVKDCNDSVKKKTVMNADQQTKQDVRRSNRSRNPVVRLNYEGRGVISPNK